MTVSITTRGVFANRPGAAHCSGGMYPAFLSESLGLAATGHDFLALQIGAAIMGQQKTSRLKPSSVNQVHDSNEHAAVLQVSDVEGRLSDAPLNKFQRQLLVLTFDPDVIE